MRKFFIRIFSAILVLSFMMIPVTVQAADQPVVAISWEDYKAGAKGNTGDMVVTAQTDYLVAEVKSIASNATQRAINYTIDQPTLFSAGDSVLIRVVARAVDAPGQMYFTLGRSGQEVLVSTDTVAVPTTWTEFFFPIAAGGNASRLYMRLGQQIQTLHIRDLEVINYHDLSLSTLPTGSRDATVAAAVDWNSYKAGAKGNTGDVVVSQQTVTGLYTQVLRAEVKTIADNPTQRAVNYTLSSVNAGDNVLVRLVARSVGGEGILRLSLRDTTAKKEVSSADYTVPTGWTEYYIPLSLASAAPNRLLLRLGHKVQTIEVADLELINYGSTELATLPIGSRPLIEPVTVSLETDMPITGTVTGSASHTFGSELSVDSGDMVMFGLVVRGQTASCHIRLTAKFENATTVMEYPVPVQDTQINMPITADGELVSFTLEALDGPVVVSEAKAENRLTATQEDLMVESGMHMLDGEFTDYALGESGLGAGKTADLVCSGGYIYSIGSGKLTVSDAATKTVLGTVSGLGDTRQIALCSSGTDVMVTARGYGAFIIDVSNPAKPRVRAEYDSVEMATGISIEGDYAYISCRQYGVDVVDLSDLDHPKHICILRTGEVQSCRVVDNILYAGLWAECRVDLYDVSDPANSKKLGSAKLSGKGDGTAVYKKDGKTYLFAATGHHPLNLAVTTPLSDLRFGQGNGLDVYDVTDPTNPKWLSTSKTDGRFYSPSYDFWSVELSEENGKLYACLSSTYNGVYVYDMSSLTAPLRLAHVYIEVPKTSSNYSALTDSYRTVVYPFDRTAGNWGAVGAVAVEDGRLYLAGLTTDLIIMENDALFHAPLVQENTTDITPGGNFYDLADPGLAGFAHFDTQGQVHAVALGKYTYVAAGSDGLLLLDDDLKLQRTIPTGGICYDVQLVDGKLYVAQGRSGLVCYDEETLTELWRYENGRTVKQVRLSPKARFAMLHVGGNRAEIVRLSDRKCVIAKTAGSQMYHHNIINEVVGGRYMAFWANSTDERWYDFGENDDLDVPVEIHNFKPRAHMTGGIEAVGDLALSMTSTGYILYNPGTVTDISSGLTIHKPGQNITGKPSEHRGTLITTNRITGAIYIMDASTLTSPSLLKSFTVTGHPATAVYGEDSIYIPLGNQGLLKFRMDAFDVRKEQAALTVTADTQVTMDDGSQTVAVSGGSGTGELTYTVSDETVATVDGSGKLTYHKPGTFTLTVTKAADETYKAQTATVQITVSPVAMTGAEVTLSQSEFTYDGTEKKPAVTVKVGGKTLAEGTDYTLAYADNVAVGTATVTVTGKGNYAGTVTKTFTIASKALTDAEVTLSQSEFTYDGTEKKPAVTVKLGGKTLAEGTDYTLAYADNVAVGTATVTVTGKGNYAGTVTGTFAIAPKPLTLTVTVADKAWDGTRAAQITGITLEGVIAGDEVTAVNGVAEFASAEVGANIPVTFSGFVLEGKDAANYTLTQPAAVTATITVAKAVEEVEEQIRSLPDGTELTEEQKARVREVKAAYDALSAELQKQVDKTLAEKLQRLVELAEKKPAVTPPTGDKAPLLLLGLLALLSAAAAVILDIRRRRI